MNDSSHAMILSKVFRPVKKTLPGILAGIPGKTFLRNPAQAWVFTDVVIPGRSSNLSTGGAEQIIHQLVGFLYDDMVTIFVGVEIDPVAAVYRHIQINCGQPVAALWDSRAGN